MSQKCSSGARVAFKLALRRLGTVHAKPTDMIPKRVSFSQIDASNEATAEAAGGVQIVETFGFEIIEQTSTVPPANINDEGAAPPDGHDVVPFATTLRRIG